MEKGFSLVELLVVITILALITLISVPAINNVIIDSREKAYKEQEKAIVDAAKTYTANNPSELPISDSGTKTITVAKLKEVGILKNEDIKNPVGKNYKEPGKYTERDETFNGSVTISWNGNKYTYTYVN